MIEIRSPCLHIIEREREGISKVTLYGSGYLLVQVHDCEHIDFLFIYGLYGSLPIIVFHIFNFDGVGYIVGLMQLRRIYKCELEVFLFTTDQ